MKPNEQAFMRELKALLDKYRPPVIRDIYYADNIRDIGSVSFTAIRTKTGWRAQIDSTSQILPQTYRSRPIMWAKLAAMAKLRGANWAKECLTFQS